MEAMSTPIKTHYRACHLCEAICGLEIKTQDDHIVSIKGDKLDPFSQGFMCPKGTALEDIHTDPDRIQQPMKRVGEQWQAISWEEALSHTAEQLVALQAKHGNNAVAFYAGNPNVHNYGSMTHGGQLRSALKTINHYSATSLDQLPHHLAAQQMYGHQMMIPIVDIDHCDFLLMLGANPYASNGSLMTAPDMPKRLKQLQQRGGKFLVIDPRRSETAAKADEHLFIKPSTDAFLLLAMIQTLINNNWYQLSLPKERLIGFEAVAQAVQAFTPALAEAQTGISAERIITLARQLSQADKPAVYGRMGVSVQAFGGLCQWAIQVINILIGALDQTGGTRLTTPAFASVHKNTPAKGHFNRYQSRVSGLPEFAGELPTVALAEEMQTEGEGQIKGLISIAGNPVNSASNANALDKALAELDFYVAIDFYLNASTRHAHIILPPTSPLEHDHYDIAFFRLAVRDITRYNPAIFEPKADALHDWQIFNQLAEKIHRLRGENYQPLPAPDKLIDAGIRADVYGEKHQPDVALTLAKIKDAVHGIDLGPLKPGLLERLATKDGNIELAPACFIDDLPRLLQSAKSATGRLLLIGRRHIRSNNSWMHNSHRLVKGKPRWQLYMHPEDMASRNINDGDSVTISSRVGCVSTIVQASEDMMPGVVSLPHGWGHKHEGSQLHIAKQQAGVNCNELTDDKLFDQLCANAAFNGVPVEVEKVNG